MATVTKNLDACSDYMRKEIFRKLVSRKVDEEKYIDAALRVEVSGRWILSAGLEKAFNEIFPGQFGFMGIDANTMYSFTIEEAEYAGLITKA